MMRPISCSLVLATLNFVNGCTYLVTPPPTPTDPVSVFIADRGYHASLLLPRDESTTVEYAFGQYDWFALNKCEPWRVPGVLFVPATGTLGRRDIASPCSTGPLRHRTDTDELLELRVDRTRATDLLRALDARFAAAGEPHDNPLMDMSFVLDQHDYWMGHNCNAALVAWLRQLGCTVRGSTLEASFRIVGRR